VEIRKLLQREHHLHSFHLQVFLLQFVFFIDMNFLEAGSIVGMSFDFMNLQSNIIYVSGLIKIYVQVKDNE
jgi:hypothetical protein